MLAARDVRDMFIGPANRMIQWSCSFQPYLLPCGVLVVEQTVQHNFMWDWPTYLLGRACTCSGWHCSILVSFAALPSCSRRTCIWRGRALEALERWGYKEHGYPGISEANLTLFRIHVQSSDVIVRLIQFWRSFSGKHSKMVGSTTTIAGEDTLQ